MSQFDSILANKEPQAYALVRIVTGFLFIFHGSQKLLNFPKEFTYDLSPLMIAAGRHRADRWHFGDDRIVYAAYSLHL